MSMRRPPTQFSTSVGISHAAPPRDTLLPYDGNCEQEQHY